MMHRISITLLSVFAVFPVFAGTNLPVVNVAAGSVSARAAFGEEIKRPSPVVSVQPAQKKRVVARRPAQTKIATKTTVARTADVGAPIVAANKTMDVLSPRRPSADLWAHSTDVPLRMPSADEFTVMRSTAQLPEESLDTPSVAARPVVPVVAKTSSQPMADIDAQIARLNELQSRADNSVRESASVRKPHSIVRAPIAGPAPVVEPETPVKITRMVVPMDTDVIERKVEKAASPRIAAVRDDMTKLSPSELRQAFRKTFLSENKHLSTFQIDDSFDVASDLSSLSGEFISRRDLSEGGGIRPLEIKIKFRNDDAALSRDNYNLLTEYAGIVLSNPTRAVQISIPQNVTTNADARKLAARRLAIVEQALRDSGVSQHRILPVLAARDDNGFLLRMISNEQYDTLTQQKRNMFGDTVKTKTYKSMSW